MSLNALLDWCGTDLEYNARIRFLYAEGEKKLREAIETAPQNAPQPSERIRGSADSVGFPG